MDTDPFLSDTKVIPQNSAELLIGIQQLIIWFLHATQFSLCLQGRRVPNCTSKVHMVTKISLQSHMCMVGFIQTSFFCSCSSPKNFIKTLQPLCSGPHQWNAKFSHINRSMAKALVDKKQEARKKIKHIKKIWRCNRNACTFRPIKKSIL